VTLIASAIRTLALTRSNAVTEWAFGSWVIRYQAGFVAWRRKWEPEFPLGWDAWAFLDELEKG
jgi:hypothetical protein